MNYDTASTPYHSLVAGFARLLQDGRTLPLGRFQPAPRPQLRPHAPKALFFAPHPDDECIVGGAALRLMRQAGMKVLDVAVTLGSNMERQPGRLRELRDACDYLGLEVVTTGPAGLEKVNPRTREQNPELWFESVKVIGDILRQHRPRVVLCPHDRDWNSTHIGTHYLVMDALKELPADFTCYLIETEFWGAMTDPNLMVEIGDNDLADLIAATTFHVGEVARNPYHLLLPPWMMDNVRRGSEIVGGQGGAAPDFTFAAIYRLRKWSNGQATRFFEGGRFVPCSENLATMLS